MVHDLGALPIPPSASLRALLGAAGVILTVEVEADHLEEEAHRNSEGEEVPKNLEEVGEVSWIRHCSLPSFQLLFSWTRIRKRVEKSFLEAEGGFNPGVASLF